MANSLPYFRFTVQAWQNGDISLESYELKGLFIDICGYYWIKDCTITLTILIKKFNEPVLVNQLLELGVIKHEKRRDKIEIVFLNKQYDLLSVKRKSHQAAGSRGGKATASLQRRYSYKDKDKEKDKDKDNDKENDNKRKFDFKESLLKYGFHEPLVNDWLIVRKNKKASNTITAFNGFIAQIEKEHCDINQVLTTCIQHSWSGFKHQWIKNLENGKTTNITEREKRSSELDDFEKKSDEFFRDTEM